MHDSLKDFLVAYHLKNTPLLLGLSGGPDSMALFHLLLMLDHPFQVAHIDHGWRLESSQEADVLARLCREKGVKFHECALKLKGANLEDLSRKARHVFFQKVCTSEKLEGVVLGHHADDQAETVLKRVFEGASLPKLKGLTPKIQMEGLTLYRPLLKVRKQRILDWLEQHEISYFCDPTNSDTRFLRSRMRQTLLPTLSQQFGKQVETSLCRLGEAAEELSEFLQTILEPFRKQMTEHEGSISINFNRFPPQPPFINKVVIRDLFERQQLSLSNSVLETIHTHLQKNSARKMIQVGQKRVEMCRGILTIK